ncbi:MAG TPA: TPM domain-containing protein [Paludibacteraceae bacterium]|nr:TPM domain-containing protein [Paludibacteraceae bacterium]
MKRYLFFVLILIAGLNVSVCGQVPERPESSRWVYDFANVLHNDQVLEGLLDDLTQQTTAQMVIVTVDSLGGLTPNQFATQLGNEWGIGDKDKDNGIVMLIKPKTNEEKGEVYIATGRGMEGDLPDVTCFDITEYQMVPQLKLGGDSCCDYAVIAALQVITLKLGGTFNVSENLMPKSISDSSAEDDEEVSWVSVVFFVIAFVVGLFLLFVVMKIFTVILLTPVFLFKVFWAKILRRGSYKNKSIKYIFVDTMSVSVFGGGGSGSHSSSSSSSSSSGGGSFSGGGGGSSW